MHTNEFFSDATHWIPLPPRPIIETGYSQVDQMWHKGNGPAGIDDELILLYDHEEYVVEHIDNSWFDTKRSRFLKFSTGFPCQNGRNSHY